MGFRFQSCRHGIWFIAVSAILAAAVPSVEAGPELRSREWAIDGFRPPPRWEVSSPDRPSYPQLVARAIRGDGSERATITLVAKRVPQNTTIAALVAEAQAVKTWPNIQNVRVQRLSTTGWTAGWKGNARVQVDATLVPNAKQRPQTLRQYYFLNGSVAYVLTLIAPVEQATARMRDLDDTATRLVPLENAASVDAKASAPKPEPESAAATFRSTDGMDSRDGGTAFDLTQAER
ncbi:MAG TPA: hypothetical protein PKE31_06915 [Pseudomonadota bacterium]|nr:hypothetical protein [Pseudomonadota bacterium]